MHYKNGWARKTHKFSVVFLVPITILLLSACAGSRIIQPLNKSQWQASASFGGPLVKISGESSKKITPLSSVSGAYGFSQSVTGFASWHLGSYLYDVYHFDAGYTQELIQPFSIRPGLTYNVLGNVLFESGGDNFRFYPQVDINTYWILPNKDFIYSGISNWFELSQRKAHGKTQEQHWVPGIHAGYSKSLAAYAATMEVKYLAPFSQDTGPLADFTNIGDNGAVALYFSVSRTF